MKSVYFTLSKNQIQNRYFPRNKSQSPICWQANGNTHKSLEKTSFLFTFFVNIIYNILSVLIFVVQGYIRTDIESVIRIINNEVQIKSFSYFKSTHFVTFGFWARRIGFLLHFVIFFVFSIIFWYRRFALIISTTSELQGAEIGKSSPNFQENIRK